MSTRQDLWAFLNDHGATLLESEISEVIDLAAAASEQARQELDNANIQLTAALNRVWALIERAPHRRAEPMKPTPAQIHLTDEHREYLKQAAARDRPHMMGTLAVPRITHECIENGWVGWVDGGLIVTNNGRRAIGEQP